MLYSGLFSTEPDIGAGKKVIMVFFSVLLLAATVGLDTGCVFLPNSHANFSQTNWGCGGERVAPAYGVRLGR